MTNRDERPLTVVDEPPFDPTYDRPQDTRRPPADRGAEQAVLATLIYAPGGHALVDHELDATDFYWPAHANLWDAWHRLHDADGVPPDAITLNAALVAAKDVEAVRLLTSLSGDDANPLLAAKHTKIVRDAARLRVVQELGTGFLQLATQADADRIEIHLGEALQRLDETVLRFGATTPGSTATGLHDLSWVLDGTPPVIDPPVWCKRSDGVGLFYPGKVNGLFGDPEHGKTWVAQAAAVEALNAGQQVAMVDVDHNGPNHTAARLMLLGARWEHIADPDHFRYYEPEDGDQLLAATAEIIRLKPAIHILDSLGEVFPLFGVNSNDGDEVTGVMRKVCLAPADSGACVITIDHLPKGSEARATGFSIGSTAKKRMMRGSYLRVDATTKPVPGKIGRLALRIEKDTSGELRKACGGSYAGTFTLDSTAAHVTTWSIGDGPVTHEGAFRPTALMEQISRFIEDNDQCSGRAIRDAINSKTEYVTAALKCLIEEGFVSVMKGQRNAQLHHSIALYREAEDDHADGNA